MPLSFQQYHSKAIEVSKEELANFPLLSLPDEGADIYVFEKVKAAGVHNLNEYMVHEVWHLIEKDRGVIGNNGFIHEGTACYVQNRLMRG